MYVQHVIVVSMFTKINTRNLNIQIQWEILSWSCYSINWMPYLICQSARLLRVSPLYVVIVMQSQWKERQILSLLSLFSFQSILLKCIFLIVIVIGVFSPKLKYFKIKTLLFFIHLLLKIVNVFNKWFDWLSHKLMITKI